MVEAKLTETDFQTASARMIERYRDIEEAFDPIELTRSGNVFPGYQLIRGVLAAYAKNPKPAFVAQSVGAGWRRWCKGESGLCCGRLVVPRLHSASFSATGRANDPIFSG